MRLLYVEDEDGFALQIKTALESGGQISVDSDKFILDLQVHNGGGNPIENQIAQIINQRELSGGEYDAALVDTDLSGLKNGISQSAFRTACSMIGLPVLRYSRAVPTTSDRIKYLTTISREGSQALQVPTSVLTEGIADWVVGILQSFKQIRDEIEERRKKGSGISPSGIVASMLKEPEIDLDLLGYSGANFFFFGELIDSVEGDIKQPRGRNYATQLGYWLANYVLMFPGPILNEGAAAAYLGITKNDMENLEVRSLLASALYTGPFATTYTSGSYYIRRRVDKLMLESDVEYFADLCSRNHIKLDDAGNGKLWYYCIVNDEPILDADAVGPFDWMPRGADICRIKKSTYEKLAPWLGM